MIPLQFILIPLLSVTVAQLVKVFGDALKGKFTLSSFTEFGGMPSSHTALFTSLATEMYLAFGANSAEFAISALVLLLVMRDATGFRENLENYGKAVNLLLTKNKVTSIQPMKESIGHSFPEVIAGLILGLLVTLLARLVIG